MHEGYCILEDMNPKDVYTSDPQLEKNRQQILRVLMQRDTERKQDITWQELPDNLTLGSLRSMNSSSIRIYIKFTVPPDENGQITRKIVNSDGDTIATVRDGIFLLVPSQDASVVFLTPLFHDPDNIDFDLPSKIDTFLSSASNRGELKIEVGSSEQLSLLDYRSAETLVDRLLNGAIEAELPRFVDLFSEFDYKATEILPQVMKTVVHWDMMSLFLDGSITESQFAQVFAEMMNSFFAFLSEILEENRTVAQTTPELSHDWVFALRKFKASAKFSDSESGWIFLRSFHGPTGSSISCPAWACPQQAAVMIDDLFQGKVGKDTIFAQTYSEGLEKNQYAFDPERKQFRVSSVSQLPLHAKFHGDMPFVDALSTLFITAHPLYQTFAMKIGLQETTRIYPADYELKLTRDDFSS
ncbi:MAG TPA: hypothetical protein DCW55_00630 [Candidatus Pacebacteria bacterium]|nr:MAG: hypothetical protein A2378_04150 [Candidatus Pacebacteria bacterium RIFOXYB1_FULL_44_10]HAU98719.1 hypothetical protein [Candidatus Paceibacterota bacterium]HAX01855.1 hypothetical protein [Candidatus Paceibacterota bacterium]